MRRMVDPVTAVDLGQGGVQPRIADPLRVPEQRHGPARRKSIAGQIPTPLRGHPVPGRGSKEQPEAAATGLPLLEATAVDPDPG